MKQAKLTGIVESQIHIDDSVYNAKNTMCMYYEDMIKNWIDDSNKMGALISNIALLWHSVSFLEPFDKLALECAAMRGTDIRRFANETPYNPCWITMKILSTKEQLLKSIVTLGFYLPPTYAHSTVEPPSIPDWMRMAIISDANNQSLSSKYDEVIYRQPADQTMPVYLRELCPVCSMLRRRA